MKRLFSLEEQDVLDTPVDSIELQEQYEEVKELDKKLTEDEATLSEGLEAFNSLIGLESLFASNKDRELTVVSQEAIDVALGSICNHLGVKKEVVVRKYSLESHSLSKSDVALESVGDFIKDVWEKIKKFFAKLWEGIKAFFEKIEKFFEVLITKFNDLFEKISVLNSKKDIFKVVLDKKDIEKNKELLLKVMNLQGSSDIDFNYMGEYDRNYKGLIDFHLNYILKYKGMVVQKAAYYISHPSAKSYKDFENMVRGFIHEFSNSFYKGAYIFELKRIYETFSDVNDANRKKQITDVIVGAYIDPDKLELVNREKYNKGVVITEKDIKAPLEFSISIVTYILKLNIKRLATKNKEYKQTFKSLKDTIDYIDNAFNNYHKKIKVSNSKEDFDKMRLMMHLVYIFQRLYNIYAYYLRKVEATRIMHYRLYLKLYKLLVNVYNETHA